MPMAQIVPAGDSSIDLDDILSRAVEVGGLHHLVAALGMHHHAHAGIVARAPASICSAVKR